MSTTTELNTCECPQAAETRPDAQGQFATLRPRVDLLESADAWLLRAELPGVDEQHAEVILERNVLTISGATELHEPEGFERQYGEFRPRRYERSFRLPDEIDREGIEATVQHGVLSLRVPKAKAAQPARIAVRGA